MQRLLEARGRALAALLPPPRLQLSEWMESHLRLPESVAALPGPVRLWPFQREIADAICDPTIERVTMLKAARLGFSTLLTGAIASFVANEPAPILVLLPTDDDCRRYVTSDLEPIFSASATLENLLSADHSSKRNTMTQKRFPGGSFKIISAKAPRNLRAHNARVLIVDEIDAMSVTSEGSPIELGIKRTLSFANRKIVLGGTPVREDTSHVVPAYGESDQRVFEVPCPECGAHTEILWPHIEWEPNRPETAAFRCPHCKSLVQERFKPQMVQDGRWRPTRTEVKNHAGFRLNTLVSPLENAQWEILAAEFLKAKDSPALLQVFINTVLGEAWRDVAEQLEEEELHARAEDFSLENIPEDILFLTAGVDVQDDRIEISILGWSRTDTFVLDHQVLYGLVNDDDTWAKLDALLKARWKHPHGGTLRIDAYCVDSGDNTEIVYRFCRPRLRYNIFAIKGAAGRRQFIERSNSPIKGGGVLHIVGVDQIKSYLLTGLARGHSFRFSNVLPLSYFEQMVSERRIIRTVHGMPVRSWERIPGRRAEAWDCAVYAVAARQLVRTNPDHREDELRQVKTAPVIPVSVPSQWMTAGGL
jgi:phage terminase large subunit GpA-like protein